jgi:hypothetical protein
MKVTHAYDRQEANMNSYVPKKKQKNKKNPKNKKIPYLRQGARQEKLLNLW